jgi:protein disulfide-isomerase
MWRPIRFPIYLGLAWTLMLTVGMADEVKWYPNLESALQTAREQNRPLLLHFWSPECPKCLQADEAVFSRSSVAETLADFYVPVKINVLEQPETAHRQRVQSLPQDVILSSDGKELHRLITPASPQQYIAQLSAMAFRSGLTPNGSEESSVWGGPSSALAAHDTIDPLSGEVARASAPSYGSLAGSEASQDAVDPIAATAVAAASQPQEVINRFARRSAEMATPAADPVEVKPEQPAATASAPSAQRRWGAWPERPLEPATAPAAQEVATSAAPTQIPAATPAAPARSPGRNAAGSSMPQAGPRPPLGLDGYCPVTLLKKDVWKQGDPRYGVIHRGRLFLFAGSDEAEAFFRNPDEYSPVLAGIDPVHLADSGEPLEGKRAHGVVYRKRVYLFSSEQNLQRFWQDPEKYVSPIRQAMETDTVNRLFR